MNEQKKTSRIVLKVLIEDKEARKDDLYLFEKTLNSIIPGMGDIAKQIHDCMREKKLPCWETMRRSRQLIQAKYPELKDKKTAKHRKDKEKEYREFVRAGNGN